ncbi:MAG: hypothetical protein LBB08_00020 [Rickettsiales bacterium]|jgi:hypothetical protein|nr:hypothetical protein [Rickettsiales bacterium]
MLFVRKQFRRNGRPPRSGAQKAFLALSEPIYCWVRHIPLRGILTIAGKTLFAPLFSRSRKKAGHGNMRRISNASYKTLDSAKVSAICPIYAPDCYFTWKYHKNQQIVLLARKTIWHLPNEFEKFFSCSVRRFYFFETFYAKFDAKAAYVHVFAAIQET